MPIFPKTNFLMEGILSLMFSLKPLRPDDEKPRYLSFSLPYKGEALFKRNICLEVRDRGSLKAIGGVSGGKQVYSPLKNAHRHRRSL